MRDYVLPGLIAVSLALSAPARGQSELPTEEPSAAPLLDFFERMLRGFMTEIEPQMRDLERGFEALEPEIQGFIDRMRGMAQYHPPQVLPNGDILIRRRQVDDPPPDSGQEGSDSAPFEL